MKDTAAAYDAPPAARRMLEASQESALITDADLDRGPRILCANAAFWRVTGYEPGELVGNTARVLQGPHGDRKLLKRMQRSLQTGAAFETRGLNFHKDGTAHLATWHVEPVRSRRGEVECFVGVQRAEADAIQQRGDLRSVLSALRASPDGLLFLDLHGRVVRTNPAAVDLLQLREDQVMGRTLGELVGHHCVEVHDDGHWSVTTPAAEPSVSRTIDLRRIGQEGRDTFWTIRDTTEKRRLEALANAVNLVEQTGYVFAGVRHELGNPIHSVKMALSVLQKHGHTFPQEKQSEFYARMLDEIERIEFLLGALRNYNAHESHTLEPFELNGHISTFLRVADIGVPDDVEVVWNPSVEPMTVRGDPRGLYQVLLNLLKNAGDAVGGSSAATITLGAGRRGSRAVISVTDNGIGMSARQLESIGRPFSTTKAHGTGLGLCVSQRILTGMKGVLEFESAVGEGTTASVYLPLELSP
ncbi:MAG: PAS domain-containing protein [Nannocystaceae bacterium]|nr:PAS domain-containing protein [Nannocystaceae bacterium]